MRIDHLLILSIAAGLSPLPMAAMALAGDAEVPKDIIAAQIRKQGFECKNPERATRDKPDSKRDEAAWILKCEGVTYRVQLVPKQAAKVEKLAEEQQRQQDGTEQSQ